VGKTHKGFAVVSWEVKSDANRTAGTTEEISQIEGATDER